MPDFVIDLYHSNIDVVPAARLKAAGLAGAILKVSQGTSYSWADTWFPPNAALVRSAGIPLGGYHMLDGESRSGSEQAAYFLSKYRPQPGDIVPAMDFEDSGRKSASVSSYAAMARDFIAEIHAAGFPCMLYGHSTVKAAWPQDWRDSGADFWWVPGSSAHADIGPRGPDLWQYGPYVAPAGYPTDPAGIGRSDMSVVITTLPLIAPEADVTGDDILAGWRDRLNGAKFDDSKPEGWKAGWHMRDLAERPGEPGPKGDDGPVGPRGPAGPPGKSAVLRPGDSLQVVQKAP